MSTRILLQTILKLQDQIKTGAANFMDVSAEYFKSTGNFLDDSQKAVALQEINKIAPSNVVEDVFTQSTTTKSDTPFTDKIREQNPDVELRGDETFGELTEKLGKPKDQGLGSLYPKGEPGEIFDEANSKRAEMAAFMKAMRAAGIKNEDVMNVAKNPDIAEGKRAATSLARAADMAADTKVKQELLSTLDDDIANYGPDWWKGMGYNEGPMGRESVGNLLESMTTDINNGVIDDLIAQGMDEDKAFELMRYVGREQLKYDPKAFIRKIADELEMNDVKYDMTFWDNYTDEILSRIQKPEPRFAHGGMV
jgi:hypothetical protein